MKGTIICCLRDLVVEKFGKENWAAALTGAGFPPHQMFMPMQDVDDTQVQKLIESVCKTLGVTLVQAADAFGDYWVSVYSQKLYSHYYAGHKDAKSLIQAMDAVHVQITKSMPNARPPRFTYEWKNDKTLVMHYRSHRGLIDILAGLARGVGKFYGEKLEVSKRGTDAIEIVFPK